MLDNKKGRSAVTPRPVLDRAAHTVSDSALQPFDRRPPVELAWARYRALAIQAAKEPRLLEDSWHRRSVARAHSTWSRLFVEGSV